MKRKHLIPRIAAGACAFALAFCNVALVGETLNLPSVVLAEEDDGDGPEMDSDPEPETPPDPEPETKPDPTPETKPDPTPETTPDPTPETTPDPTPETTPDPTPETTPDPTPAPTPAPTPEPQTPPVYKLTPSASNVSLGTQILGEVAAISSSISIKNDGNVNAEIIPSITNSCNGLFSLEGVTQNVTPGNTAKYKVSLNPAMATAEGNYEATLSFCNNNDPSRQGVAVKVTVVIQKKQEEKKEEKKEEEKKPAGTVKVEVLVDPKEGGKAAGGGSITSGTSTTLVAVANSGYKFTGWYNGSNQVSGSPTFTTSAVSQDTAYTAKFKKNTVNVAIRVDDKKGRVEGDKTYNYGSDVKIKAEARDNYTFEGWYENGKKVSGDREYTIKNLTRDITYEARFNGGRYEVSVSRNPSDGGNVSGAGRYDKDKTVNLKAEPKSGYKFKGWMLNNQIVSGSTEYQVSKIDRDMSFTALFESINARTYTITSGLANQGGVIAPSGSMKVEEGKGVTFTMAPNNGYKILAVAVDNVQVGPVSTYTFSDVRANHTIAVAFAPKENAVVSVSLDAILSTSDVQALTLQKASASSQGRTSVVDVVVEGKQTGNSTSSATIVKEASQSGISRTPATVVQKSADEDKKILEKKEDTAADLELMQDQNLIGMDNAENIVEEEEGYDYDSAGGVMQMLDLTTDEVLQRIDNGQDSELLIMSYENGFLNLGVDNTYDVNGSGDMNDSLLDNATLPNLLDIVKDMLTAEEKLALYNGSHIYVNFSVSDAAGVPDEVKQAMEGLEGISVQKYLNVSLLKTVNDQTDLVENLNSKLRLVLAVPEDMKSSGEPVCLVRYHNGKAEILENVSSDKTKVAVDTDGFSTYAFAFLTNGAGSVSDHSAQTAAEPQKAGMNGILLFGIIAAALCAVAAVVITFVLKKR